MTNEGENTWENISINRINIVLMGTGEISIGPAEWC